MAKQHTPYDQWLIAQTSLESHYVEKLMEHVFLGELLKECWFHRQKVVEVTRAEVDASGYDLILEADGIIRHIQLKATRKGGSTHFQDINRKLESRVKGCIIWMEFAATGRTAEDSLSLSGG